MKIALRLLWIKTGTPIKRTFKLPGIFETISEYSKRINASVNFEIAGQRGKSDEVSAAKSVWFCDRSPGAKVLSSEEVASELEKIKNSGIRELEIVIGGSDGFTRDDYASWQPSLRWSFGRLTLPHELAAAVACEQIYRALAIIARHPYHSGH